MGIHALDDLSKFAHQDKEPYVAGLYDYDEFVVYSYTVESGDWRKGEAVYNAGCDWAGAKKEFLRLFNEEKKVVALFGRVFD